MKLEDIKLKAMVDLKVKQNLLQGSILMRDWWVERTRRFLLTIDDIKG